VSDVLSQDTYYNYPSIMFIDYLFCCVSVQLPSVVWLYMFQCRFRSFELLINKSHVVLDVTLIYLLIVNQYIIISCWCELHC